MSTPGALSQDVNWRWCFWINLPCAAVTAAGVIFILKTTKPLGTPLHSRISLRDKLSRVDIVGTILTSAFMVMIIVPIQDSTYQGWKSAATLAVSLNIPQIQEIEHLLKHSFNFLYVYLSTASLLLSSSTTTHLAMVPLPW